MAFSPKTWANSPETTTPISAAALVDLEERVTDYSDAVGGGGIELGSASITSSVTSTSTTYADIAGLSVTVTVAARPIEITFSASAMDNNASAGGVSVAILEDGSIIGATGSFIASASAQVPGNRILRRAPSAGSHTYKCQLKRVFAFGTATLYADNYVALGPATLSVKEV